MPTLADLQAQVITDWEPGEVQTFLLRLLTFIGAGGGVTMQQTYNDSAGANPSILLTAANGAVNIKAPAVAMGKVFGIAATGGTSILSVFDNASATLTAGFTQSGGAISMTGTGGTTSLITTDAVGVNPLNIDSGNGLNLGTTTALLVQIGRAGIATTVSGTSLTLDAATSLIGTAGAGAVTLGAMTGDTTLPTGNITYAAATGKAFSITGNAASQIIMSAGAGAGANLTIKGQAGTAAAGGAVLVTAGNAGAGAVGGTLTLSGGLAAGAGTFGGVATLQGGPGNTVGGGGAAYVNGGIATAAAQNGGDVHIDAGNSTGGGGGVAGTVHIGDGNGAGFQQLTAAIAIGKSTITTTITGGLTQLTGAVSLSANGASSFTVSAGALTLSGDNTASSIVLGGGNGTVGILRYNQSQAIAGGAVPATLAILTGGATGPATATQTAWMPINIQGTLRFIPYWT